MADAFSVVTTAGDLTRVLRSVQPGVKRRYRTSIPVLTMAKFSGGRITVTDLDLQLSAALPSLEFQGDALAPFWTLLRLASAFDADTEIRLSGEENHVVSLRAGGSSYRLAGLAVSEFPEMAIPADMEEIKADGGALRTALRFCQPYASQEETRYYLNGVCLFGTSIVATDGHRMAMVDDVLEAAPSEKFIIPNRAVKALLTMADPQVSVGKLRLVAKSAGMELKAKLIDGTYPDVMRVVPQDANMETSFDRMTALRLLKRLSAISSRSFHGAAIAAKSGKLAVAAQGVDDGFGLEVMDCGGTGFQRAFNINYLTQVLSSLDGDIVRFRNNGDRGAPIIAQADGGMRRIVLMPMRCEEKTLAAAAEAIGTDERAAA
jgi:DNA polymerase sliding clamp subunit (PCNA homolog)